MISLSITERPPAAFPNRRSLRTHMGGARCAAKRYLAAVFFAGAALLPLAGQAEEQQDQPPQASAGSQQIPINSGKAAEAVLSAVNAYRAENKIGELAWNNTLWQTAQHYAEFLAANKASGRGADGKIPQQRAEEKGYPCPVAENTYSADPAEKTTKIPPRLKPSTLGRTHRPTMTICFHRSGPRQGSERQPGTTKAKPTTFSCSFSGIRVAVASRNRPT